MTIVDSSSWIEALRERGKPEVRARVEKLLEQGEAVWCDMIRLELWRGARAGAESRAIEVLQERIQSLEIGQEVWDRAIELAKRAREIGLTAATPDYLIVAVALHHGVDIEHCDARLDRLLAIRLEG